MEDKKLENLTDEAKDKVEEVKEEVVVEEAAAEEVVVEESAPVVEEAPVAEEAPAEPASVAEEAPAEAEKAVEETTEEVADPTVLKGTAPNSEPVEVKKGKKPVNKANVIVIVVCAVIVVAAVVFVGISQGWFDFLKNTSGSLTLADLSAIEVVEDEVTVTDETVASYVESILSGAATTEEITDGKVETGDTVNIDYVGKYADTGEEFEGGSAEGYDLTVGSGSFIDGFEDGLIGKKVGEVVELKLTFPEDYSSEDLAGKDVIFTVTINSISRTTTPDLTDAWVAEYSAANLPEALTTVAEFEEYCRKTLEDYYYRSAIYEYLEANSEVNTYDTEKEQELMDYTAETLEYYASMYGMDADSYAALYGYEDAESYEREQADGYLKIAMIVDEICKQNNISVTDEEFNESVEQYMKDQGYSDYYTVDEFLELSGDTWKWLYTELELKYNKAMDSLRDNVVFVEPEETTVEETAAE